MRAFIIVLVFCFVVKQGNSQLNTKENLLQQLQGIWQSSDDSMSVVEFKGYKQIDYYEGKKLFEYQFNFFSKCSENASLKDKKKITGKYLILFEKLEEVGGLCYEIESITSMSLTLFYNGSGRFLNYKKVK